MESNKYTFRFDDVSINEDPTLLSEMASYLFDKFEGCQIIFGLSPLVHSDCGKRVFPRLLNAYADYRIHYNVVNAGKPYIPDERIEWAGHGIVHINHQLLSRQAQELSILTSCSLAGGRIFIPPWNKWNTDTEVICKENYIHLVKFEDGWKGAEHEKWDESHKLWYLHGYAWTLDSLKKWFDGEGS